MIYKIRPAQMPAIKPMSMGCCQQEYGASNQPRNNPAFDDTWIIGATGAAQRVIPQGIDYSRTPCCLGSNGAGSTSTLFIGVVGVPLAILLLTVLFSGYSK
jgi:hypothetical protein